MGTRQKKFAKLENLTRDINEQLRKKEQFSSKDSVVKNPPFEARESINLFVNNQKFIRELAYCLPACHSELPDNLMPPVIIKFIKVAQKDLVYEQRKILRAEAKNISL